MSLDLKKIKFNKEKVAFCRFKKLGNQYLLTNEPNSHIFLEESDFKKFLEGKLKKNSKIYKELQSKNFIKDDLDLNQVTRKCHCYNNFLFQGPSLHIIVVTLRCNFKCVYCQASSCPVDQKKYDMDIKTAKKTVDIIFESPNDVINIEFQGGEPLLNWSVLSFIVKYAKKKNKEAKKDLSFSLVSNFSLMTEEKYKFLTEQGIGLCTSLDGPEELQNKNRPWPGKNSYETTIRWIKKIKKKEKEQMKKDKKPFFLSALTTISRFSLKYPREIIKEYVKWDFNGIHLRPLSFLGLSGGSAKGKVGYSAEEFIDFWKKSMDYLIEINQRGKFFYERGTRIMLRKILTDQNPSFVDLLSPCGAAIGQLLYNYNGKVYTCDEGRMVKGDTFMLGDVKTDNYEKIILNPKVKTMIAASILENLPCDNCVYKPYCGVCPVLSYALYGTLFPQIKNTTQCKIHQAMLDYIFSGLQNKKVEEVFLNWIKR